MPNPDRELAEEDRHAEKRAHDDAYRAAHPEAYEPNANAHPLFRDILNTIFPQVSPVMGKAEEHAAARRFG